MKLTPGVIHQSGSMFMPGPKNHSIEHTKLPVGTYLVEQSMMQGYYLKAVEDLALPRKLYGSTISRAARIVQTFKERRGTTGTIASGMKGSGKSLLAKATASICLEEGFPVLLINKPFAGDSFAQFLLDLNTPFMALLDEFEKVYSAEVQEQLLTLLDGVFQSKGLFFLTCNNYGKIDGNMLNRPSRIFYNIPYRGMEIDAIQELAEDTLKDKTKVDDILKLASIFDNEMNFDMVQSAIEEVNRYPEQPLQELMEMMNLRPSNVGLSSAYSATITVKGKTYSGDNLYPREPALALFSFKMQSFMIREGFSDQEIAARLLVQAPSSKPAAAAKSTGTLEEEDATSKKRGTATSRAAKDKALFNKNRPTLGDDYERCWLHWKEQISYGEPVGNLSTVYFNSGQLVKSDVKVGSYTFENEGQSLTLTKKKTRIFGTADYYDRL